MVGSSTSSRDHSGHALRHGKCSVLHPQSRPRPGNPYLPFIPIYTHVLFPSVSVYVSQISSSNPLFLLRSVLFCFLRRNQSAVDLIFFVGFYTENCSRSTLVTMCGMWPWRGVTRSSWRNWLLPQIRSPSSGSVFS